MSTTPLFYYLVYYFYSIYDLIFKFLSTNTINLQNKRKKTNKIELMNKKKRLIKEKERRLTKEKTNERTLRCRGIS